ncbi:MAG: hypothetical protein WAL10_11910 [Acetobacteraceae bacterium]|jgi:hypothetical protein
MSITTTRSSSQALAGALQAHRDAAERHRRAVAQAGVARQAHTAASAARERVLARASEGADVGLAELQRAAEAATDAGDRAALAAAVRDGALSLVHAAHVAALVAAVDDHHARTSAARIEVLERATEVDRALDVVRARLASFLDACGGLRALHNEAAAFAQHELPAALASNPVLAKLHPSEQPRMAVVPAPRLDLAIELRLTAANIGGPSTRPVASLAAMVAGVTRSGAAKAA